MATQLGTARVLRAIRTLLPSGPVWDSINDTAEKFWEAFAEQVDNFLEYKDRLPQEINPGTSTEFLPLHEQTWLFPDEYAPPGATVHQRRASVAAKSRVRHTGPTTKFFENYAAQLGISVVITEGEDIDFVVDFSYVGDEIISQRGSALWRVVGDTGHVNWLSLLAFIRRNRPAHTELVVEDVSQYDADDGFIGEEYIDGFVGQELVDQLL